MCFDTCTINIRVSIRVRGLHLVFSPRKLRNNGRPFFGKWCTKVQIFCEFQWTNIACQLNIKSSHWSPRSKSQAHPIEVVRIQFWGSSSCLKAILLGGWALPLWKMMEWVRQLGFDEIPIFFNGKSFKIPWFQSPPTSMFGLMIFLLPLCSLAGHVCQREVSQSGGPLQNHPTLGDDQWDSCNGFGIWRAW